MNKVNFEKDRIFVSLASYRDYELRNTINDLFAKAKYKERVFVGVLNQIDLINEKELVKTGKRSEK